MLEKKSRTTFVIMVILLVTLVMAVTPVGAATRKLSLLGATVKVKGGATFTFKVIGDFNKFDGYVVSHGQYFDLNCHIKNTQDDILVCRGANRGLGILGGKNVQVVVNGFSFTTFVNVEEVHEYCYPVFDWGITEPWQEWGTYCQDLPAKQGDMIEWDNPYWGVWPYQFWNDPGSACVEMGEGYYFCFN